MSALPESPPRMTFEDYLAFEATSDIKHEWVNGELVALAGGSMHHSLVAGNLFAALHTGLRGRGCKVFGADMRYYLSMADRTAYPDVSVVCGEPQYYENRTDTLLNPSLIAEVLSPSTASNDRGPKWFAYQALPTLQHGLFVAQDTARIECFARQTDGTWRWQVVSGLDETLDLVHLDVGLLLSDIYEQVDL